MRRWEAMPDLHWAELIDGIVYMPSPVSRIQGDFHSLFTTLLGTYAIPTPGCRSGVEGTWLMSDDSVPQPDITLEIRPERGGQSRIEGKYSSGAPELIVEVSHTTRRRDLGIKLRLYERSGVRGYITVGPGAPQIIYRLFVDGKHIEIAADADGIYRSQPSRDCGLTWPL
jgi:Uma2 family endonuclease